jgi:hypothetical protein
LSLGWCSMENSNVIVPQHPRECTPEQKGVPQPGETSGSCSPQSGTGRSDSSRLARWDTDPLLQPFRPYLLRGQDPQQVFRPIALPAAIPSCNPRCVTVTDVERAASRRAFHHRERTQQRGLCSGALTALRASQFLQSLGIEGVSVCFECFSPLLLQTDVLLGLVVPWGPL